MLSDISIANITFLDRHLELQAQDVPRDARRTPPHRLVQLRCVRPALGLFRRRRLTAAGPFFTVARAGAGL
jgi:hypothetical protein